MRDRLPEQEANIALLIDADNASPEHLDEVLLVLGELGTINIRRAYGNWAKASLKGWGQLTGAHSIVPMQQFDVVKGKSATDMRMTIDAMDLLYRGNVDGFGIMSSDSDFLPLAQRIREDGLPVYGFGTAKTPVSFQQACTRFFDVGALGNRDRVPDRSFLTERLRHRAILLAHGLAGGGEQLPSDRPAILAEPGFASGELDARPVPVGHVPHLVRGVNGDRQLI